MEPINKEMDKLQRRKREIAETAIKNQRYEDMNSGEQKYRYIRNNVDKIVIDPETKEIIKILMK